MSLWTRDIQLTAEQKKKLSENGVRKDVIERRRSTRLHHENGRRQEVILTAQKQIPTLNRKELWLVGCMLYWAEGGKTQRGLVRFSNSDPLMIKLMMTFFRKICAVPESKLRGHIHLHPHLNVQGAEEYWSSITGIPPKQFFKTSRQRSKAGKHKHDSLPFGTFNIYICNTNLFLKIYGWVQGIYQRTLHDPRVKIAFVP